MVGLIETHAFEGLEERVLAGDVGIPECEKCFQESPRQVRHGVAILHRNTLRTS